MFTSYADYLDAQNSIQSTFNKIKVGVKQLDDAILKLGDLKKVNPRLADKRTILTAIDNYDLALMREISNFFYKTSGIYARILRYMAFMYRYDWFVTPYIKDKKIKKEKILDNFYSCLDTLDNFGVKKFLGEVALKVLRNGVYYGYKVPLDNGDFTLQELPPNYCRNRFYCGKKPAVEFNMKYFDENFRDTEQKAKILKMFPAEFRKGYSLYKKGKLKPEGTGDSGGWYLLDPDMTEKFTANGEEYPAFISVIPLIIDLDEAQDLDKKKTMQRLLKIVVQKMPLDKNGDLVFDIDEARQLHNNAVQMLGRAIGVDVLTTFADVTVEDLQSDNSQNQTDDLQRVERQLYNEAGVSQMQFNTDGNIALEKSILNDEATMYNMLLQFEAFLNELLKKNNLNKRKMEFRVQLLTTTIYNYKDLAKLYKEQTQLGYSKFLPQLALGQSQSSILANAFFENEVLDLVNVFIPPLMSSTMNSEILKRGAVNENEKGRPEKENDQKSEKTIQNQESMS
jgi:ribosomal protein L17